MEEQQAETNQVIASGVHTEEEGGVQSKKALLVPDSKYLVELRSILKHLVS